MTTFPMPRPRSWARQEYERMVDTGILGPDDRVELLEGEIVQMSPEKTRHAVSVDLVSEALRRAFGAGYTVRVQHPLALSDVSEPEPDIAVVTGAPRDYVEGHPRTAALIVEVSDSSLAYDQTRKLAAYARGGIVEYWIVNLVDERLDVHREPVGDDYTVRKAVGKGASVSPLGVPACAVFVDDLLP